MAKAKAKPKGNGKPHKAHPKQEHLPDLGPQKLQDVIDAAVTYREQVRIRMAATEAEVEAKAKVIDVMTGHGLTHYEYGGIEVDLRNKVEVKVKSPATGANMEE